jgi:hypothetical protein
MRLRQIFEIIHVLLEGSVVGAVSRFGSETPMKRPAQPEEIAPAFVFPAAPSSSSYITGLAISAATQMGNTISGGVDPTARTLRRAPLLQWKVRPGFSTAMEL